MRKSFRKIAVIGILFFRQTDLCSWDLTIETLILSTLPPRSTTPEVWNCSWILGEVADLAMRLYEPLHACHQ